MPYLKISPPTGPLNVFYSISTPTCHDAEAIIPDLPTVLFLHPLYIPQQIFQAQFADHDLRQFNLVALDLRSHGETQGVIGEATYTPADDVYHFMEALNLPPCHIFGISIGCLIGMQLASAHPDRVLSLTLCSPKAPTETEELAKARLEVHEEWSEVLQMPEPATADHLAEEDRLLDVGSHTRSRMNLLTGLKELAFNNEMSDLTLAILESSLVQAQNHCKGSSEGIQESYRSLYLYPLHRQPLPESELVKIKCPVCIIYCTDDLLYPVENAQELESRFKNAGLEATLHLIPGPHYGCISSAAELNSIVREFILSCHDVDSLPSIPLTAECMGSTMKTPFSDRLAQYDYQPLDNLDIQVLPSGR